MKNTWKFICCLLLTTVLALSLFACAGLGEEETEPVLMVPATMPDYSDETLSPIYTRPSEDDSEEEEGELPEQGGETEENQKDNTTSKEDQNDNTDTDEDSGDSFTDDSVGSNMQSTAKPLSWTYINAFSIKSSSMSVTQMRTLCVDFFRYAKTALWTPDESIDYIRNSKGTEDSMTGGSLYGGLPYVGSSSGNIYRLLDYMGADGKVDMSDMLNLTGGQLETKDLRYFGNQCANGAAVGWCRVINSVTKHYTAGITPASGYVMLGSYTKDADKLNTIKEWSTTYGTDEFCKANGTKVMFAAYAQLQIGDGLVYYTTAGHVIMAATDAHVEYISGTDLIDGSKSYITIIDQAQKWETYTTAEGTSYQIKSSVDAKVTFQQLYNSNYVPFTFKEFLGEDPVENTVISLNYTGSAAKFSDLMGKTITCNYGITDAYIIVTDASGNQVYKHAVRNTTPWGKTLTLKSSGTNVDSWGSLPTSGSYTVTVTAQLGTGERPVVYNGQLTMDN